MHTIDIVTHKSHHSRFRFKEKHFVAALLTFLFLTDIHHTFQIFVKFFTINHQTESSIRFVLKCSLHDVSEDVDLLLFDVLVDAQQHNRMPIFIENEVQFELAFSLVHRVGWYEWCCSQRVTEEGECDQPADHLLIISKRVKVSRIIR